MIGSINEEQAKERMEEEAKAFKKSDYDKILQKKSKLEHMFAKGPLAEFVQTLQLLLSMLADFFSGRYKQVPWMTIAAIGGALLYVLSPIDIIADFIPVIGLIDDVAVLGACIAMIGTDIEQYRKWKETEGKDA